MHYSETESMVRLSRFKKSGKWYDDHAINMAGYYNTSSVHEAVKLAAKAANISHDGYFFVVLEPYHEYAHPVTCYLNYNS